MPDADLGIDRSRSRPWEDRDAEETRVMTRGVGAAIAQESRRAQGAGVATPKPVAPEPIALGFDPLEHARAQPLHLPSTAEQRTRDLARPADVDHYPPGALGDEMLARTLSQTEAAADRVVVDPATRAGLARNAAALRTELRARAAHAPPPDFDPEKASAADLSNALAWLSKHRDAQMARRTFEEAKLRTPGATEQLLRAYEGRRTDQERVLHRALELHGDRRCRAGETVESLEDRLDALEHPPEADAVEREPPPGEQVAGLDGYTGTREEVARYTLAQGLEATNPGTTTGSVLASVAAVRSGGDVDAMRAAGARGAMVEGMGGGAGRAYENEREVSTRVPVERPLVKEEGAEPVNGRRPSNYRNAFGAYPMQRLSRGMRAEYPMGVRFNVRGFPDFSPYAVKTVRVEGMNGERRHDSRLANIAAGLRHGSDPPDGYTWHHVEDGVTMQLVPEDLHDAVRHTGGAAVLEHRRRQEETR